MSHKISFTLRKRSFLSPTSTGHTSYILAEAESSRNGEYKWGNYLLTIATAVAGYNSNSSSGTKRARRKSLGKIDRLIMQLELFRAQLLKEAGLYEQKEKESKRRKTRSGKTKGKG